MLISGDFTLAFEELYLEEDVGIAEHAFFETYDQELTFREVLLYHLAYVLGMA